MNNRLRMVLYIGFINNGLVGSTIGPLLTIIKSDINMSYAQAGLILSGQSVGSLIAVAIGNYALDRIDKKKFLLLGGILLVAGLLGCMLAPGYLSLLLSNIVCGIGSSIYAIGINAMCADNTDENMGKAMNLLHFFYGFGALSCPVLITVILNSFNSWRLPFGVIAIFPVIVTALVMNLPVHKTVSSKSGSNSRIYKEKYMMFAGITTFLYVGMESSIYGWIPAFWQRISPDDAIPFTLMGTIFWSALTVGRLFCGRLTDRTGLTKYVTYVCFATAALGLIWFMIPSRTITIICVVMMGLTMSGIYPTNLAAAASNYEGDSAKVAAFITVFASVGGFFVPSAIGRLADLFGITVFPSVILGAAGLMFLSSILSLKVLQKHQS